MNNKLQEQLYKKYPLIFKQKDLPMSETCMCWGISTGDGWYHIIDELCKKLNSTMNQYDIIVSAAQVKEKYGTLRFYYDIELGTTWKFNPSIWFKIVDKVCGLIRKVKYIPSIENKLHKYRNYQYELKGKKYTNNRRGNWTIYERVPVYQCVNNLVRDYVSWYEDFSDIVCEKCGVTGGKQNKSGWIVTLCDKCRDNKTDTKTDTNTGIDTVCNEV